MTLAAATPLDLADPSARSLPSAELTMRTVSPEVWENTVAGFDDVCQEQLHAFAAARWPGVRQEPQLFVRAGEVIGGCLVMVQPLPLGIGRIAVVKWAPMLRDTTRGEPVERYRDMIEALIAHYDRERGMMLSVLPHAYAGPGNPHHDTLKARGFREGARLLYPDRYLVRLRLDDAAQRASFHQKWRYHLNRADKQGLTFERAPAAQWTEFAALYNQMVDRKRFPDHSAFDTVPQLMAIADDRLRPELFFVRKDGRMVAGAIIFKAGRRAVYLYGATSDEALELRAGYFLHWHIIRWLRDNTRADWYDLGGTDGFQGLHQFKKGMVGDAGLIVPVPPVANYASRLLPRLAGEGAFAARELLHAARRRLDRLRPDRAKPDQARTGDAS